MLSRENLRELLYARGPATRFTQDFPVLPDVWVAFAEQSSARPQGQGSGTRQMVDLLITPDQMRFGSQAAFVLAQDLDQALKSDHARHAAWPRSVVTPRKLACHHFAVSVRMDFDELVRVILPRTQLWQQSVDKHLGPKADDIHSPAGQQFVAECLADLDRGGAFKGGLPPDVLWMARVIGTIAELHWKVLAAKSPKARQNAFDRLWPPPMPTAGESDEELRDRRVRYYLEIVHSAARLVEGVDVTPDESDVPLILQVSLNRSVDSAVHASALAVKADAARLLFNIRCHKITWAVVDDGIDAQHPAFLKSEGGEKNKETDWAKKSRVLATYDFSRIRDLLSLDPDDQEDWPDTWKNRLEQHASDYQDLKASLQRGKTLNWDLVRPLVDIPHDAVYQVPRGNHGTHVAGILGGDWRNRGADEPLVGICPDINLLDLRVFDERGRSDEFSVMAALQFLRHLNGDSTHRRVHGVNLSLSIKHDVANFACGRTPVCNECERLVAEGLVVVAAAGNDGYQSENAFSPLAAFRTVSITDPGNAESVITVGATHRQQPHTYGVSYFSSRGPTGDGRLKPDLVAPGEKIESSTPGRGVLRQDGTSMAAPHVSGAAALLMARHAEFIGDPLRIKRILCESATDLGREKYFQGHGMLDILRALQSV